jgi:hypothetical protein
MFRQLPGSRYGRGAPRFGGTPVGGVRPQWHDLVRLPDLELDSLVPTVLPMRK